MSGKLETGRKNTLRGCLKRRALAWILGTPATLINRKIVLGFQAEKMKKLLGLEDQPQEKAVNQMKEVSAKSSAGAGSDHPVFHKVDESVLDQTYDFVTIGGGPAGASAAVYAARGKLKTLVIDKAPSAGTLAITHKIANYPGVRKEQTGLELLADMQLQAQDFGAVFVQTHVLDVDFSDFDIKKLKIPEGIIKAKSVFIGVGAKAPTGKMKGEEEFTGRGVSYCSTCDAAFFEDKTVVVAGDNAEALHEAEALSRFCKEVKLLIPGADMKGEASLSDLEDKKNVTIYGKHRIKEISGEHSVENIVIQDNNREQHTWQVDGVFLYLGGMKPGTDFLKDFVLRDSEGYVTVD
jgi:thioredoxin reductase (NADPH)